MKTLSIATFRYISLCLLLLSLVNCTKASENTTASHKPGGNVDDMTTVLAKIADDDKAPPSPPAHGEPSTSQVQPASYEVLFSESGRGVAYIVQKDGKLIVVKNNSKGKEYSNVGTTVLSPDGKRVAYAAFVDGKWRMVVDGKEGRPYETLLTPIFSPDGLHVMYQAKAGDKWYIVVDETPNAGTLASYTTPEFSSDSASIVYIEASGSSSDMRLIVSDLKFGKQIVKTSVGDLLFTTNTGKTRVAATQVIDKKLRVFDFSFAKPEDVHEGPRYDVIEKLAVGDDGQSVAYCAIKGGKRLVVLNDKEEALPKGLLPEMPVIRPDNKGVGALLVSNKQFFLQQSFFDSAEKGKLYDEAAHLAYSKDGRSYAYAARMGEKWFVVVNGKEGPAYDKVVWPLFSPDGKFLVYRARKDGKRFIVVADTNGNTVKQHPAYEQVFDVKFTAGGKSVAYGVKDGNQLVWKVETL